MEHNMILSASGWRKIFAVSENGQDKTPEIGSKNKALAVFAAEVFSDYVRSKAKTEQPVIACGTDTRPTGPAIADAVIKTLTAKKIAVRYTGVTAAPEIMAYAKNLDGFIYISASHNPVGHNGIKFGLNTGGVLNGEENAELRAEFLKLCADKNAAERAEAVLNSAGKEETERVYKESAACKRGALEAYYSFARQTVTASGDTGKQNEILDIIRRAVKEKSFGIVCDMNGSARTSSIDSDFFADNGINFYAINSRPGQIAHEIIPEPENLVWCAEEMTRLQKEGHKDAVLGYMPDCDGDRGNIIYWDEKQNKAVILKAQEVFSLSVLAELAYTRWLDKDGHNSKPAVAVNGPTSMRIEEIAAAFGAKVFRAEVGEANAVNLAQEKRNEGWNVRICGEGSNGGNITYPSAVRDPLNTLFAIIKLLAIRENGLYRMWCEKSGNAYKEDFTLTDIIDTLPAYTTTGVAEPRAVLHINTADHAVLKGRFQKIFEKEYKEKIKTLASKYGITSYEAVITSMTKETRAVSDFSKSAKGGLKIVFYSENKEPAAFIWMRGSGTEPVFRVMCDVKGTRPEMESELLAWETEMLLKADS